MMVNGKPVTILMKNRISVFVKAFQNSGFSTSFAKFFISGCAHGLA